MDTSQLQEFIDNFDEIRKEAHILSIETNSEIIQKFKALARLKQLNWDYCQTGKEALEQCNVKPYSVIVHDLTLPDMTGLELLDHLQRKRSTVKTILYTATPSMESAINAINQGAFAFIQQNNNLMDLLKQIHRALLAWKYDNLVQALKHYSELLLNTNNQLHQSLLTKEGSETSLREEKEQAEQINRANSQLLTHISHEVQVTVDKVLGITQVLTKKGKSNEVPEIFQQYYRNIETHSHDLTELMNDVLNYSKIEAGNVSIVKEDFPLQAIVSQIFDLYHPQTVQKKIKYTYEIASCLPKTVRTDITTLHQILIHLIENAIQFTPEGKGIKLKIIGDSEVIVFMVIDQGIGIPKNRQTSIFSPFERDASLAASPHSGIGLGLAISQKLANLLGGKIVFGSQIGIGSTFNLILPLEKDLLKV